MRLFVLLSIIVLPLYFFSCCTHSSEEEDIKLVAIGDSITMGIQDIGLVKDYQINSFPYLVSKQLGIDKLFEQPLVSSPGFGVPPYEVPLKFQDGRIIADYYEGGIENIDKAALFMKIFLLLENVDLQRPYDNLGVGGARLHDVRNTTNYLNSVSPDNFLFDIVLRNFNPFFGNTTTLQQAIQLEPEIILLWIGNNDILGSVMAGGDPELITDTDSFKSEFTLLLSELQNNTDATIFMANIPGYLPIAFAFDDIFKVMDGFSQDRIPVLFDPETFMPINFVEEGEFFIPLLIEEDAIKYLLLTALIDYLEEGMGIPNKQNLIDMGFTDPDGLIIAMKAAGLNPEGDNAGIPLPGDLTITEFEEQFILSTILEYNIILQDLSFQFHIPLIDIHSLWNPEQEGAFSGYSGEFVLDDPFNTTFSLDGVHPNNLGHAIIANAFIDKINEKLHLEIQKLDLENYKGQYAPYVGTGLKRRSIQALKYVRELYQ